MSKGRGNGEFSLQANGDQGGRILSQVRRVPSKWKREQRGTRGARGAREARGAKRTGKARGMHHVYNLCSRT
jgi:hypothetical protein